MVTQRGPRKLITRHCERSEAISTDGVEIATPGKQRRSRDDNSIK